MHLFLLLARSGRVTFIWPCLLLGLLALAGCVFSGAPAQAQGWAKSMGGTSVDEGLSIAVDGSGNVYTTGYFGGTVDFDPGPGVANLTSAGIEDIFVSKFDASGNYVWAKRMGGTGFDAGSSIAVDGSGNVYTTGSFEGTADFDPGPGVANLTSGRGGDIFVSKLDASGNYVWAKSIMGASLVRSIAVDGSGNVYTTGFFFNTADFDPGPGVANLSSASAGGYDIFVSKLDASGNYVWAKRMGGMGGMGGIGDDEGRSIAVDGSGNVYTTGYFRGTADFDPGPGEANLTSAGFNDIFVSKLDASGNYVWAKRMGGTSEDEGYSIAVDGSGNVYTTGYFFGTADFDPGPGVANLTSAGSTNIFVSKLDASGNYVWAKRMGGTSFDRGYSIAVDGSGNVYTTGIFLGMVDFDPGPGEANLTSAGGADIFVSKLLPDGSLVPPPPTTSVCGSPTATIGQPFVLVAPTYNCATNEIRFNTVGGDGSTITYMAVGITSETTSCTDTMDNGVAQDIRDQRLSVQPFTLFATQNGVTVSYVWDALAACSGSIPPTPGSFALTRPTYNCTTGAITFNTSGGDGTAITYTAVGVSRSAITANSGTVEAGLRGDPKTLIILATQSGVTVNYVFDFAAFCATGSSRQAAESLEALHVTVFGNPTQSETVEVEVRGASGQAVCLHVVSATGTSVSELSVKRAGAVERQTVRLGREAGIYLLTVSSESQRQTVKIVRQ